MHTPRTTATPRDDVKVSRQAGKQAASQPASQAASQPARAGSAARRPSSRQPSYNIIFCLFVLLGLRFRLDGVHRPPSSWYFVQGARVIRLPSPPRTHVHLVVDSTTTMARAASTSESTLDMLTKAAVALLDRRPRHRHRQRLQVGCGARCRGALKSSVRDSRSAQSNELVG